MMPRPSGSRSARPRPTSQPLPATVAEGRGTAEAANLLGIYAALADIGREQAVARFAGKNFSEFKTELADLAAEVLGKIGGEMQRLVADPGYIDALLRRGTERAKAIAEPNLRAVFDIMGLLRP